MRLSDLPPHVQEKARALLDGQRVVSPAAGVSMLVPSPATDRVVIGNPPIAIRGGDLLTLNIPFPPRTKKNGTRNGQHPMSVKRFERQVIDWVEPFKAELGLPLPDVPYNCMALFYCDNDRADTVGLMQGLADALEKAGVVTDDRWLRTWDGTDQAHDPARPRIVVRLSPIARPR